MHNGSRLKKFIEKSGIKVQTIIEKSNVSKGSLYNYFDYEDIPRKKLKSILDVLGISLEDFFTEKNVMKDDDPPYSLKERLADCEKVIELLKKQLADKEEIIQLLKEKKINKSTAKA